MQPAAQQRPATVSAPRRSGHSTNSRSTRCDASGTTVPQLDSAAQQYEAAASSRQDAANALLELLSPDGGVPPPLSAQRLPGGAGVGLVAVRDVQPDEALLAVPLSLVLETIEFEV